MSNTHKVHVEFPGRILFIGFGSIGQGVLPLVLRHIGIAPERITIITAEDKGSAEAAQFGIKFIKERLTRENYRRVLNPLLGRGDFVINVSVEVSSIALIKLCWEKGAMYLDTCIEPWPGGYTDPTVPAAQAHQLCAARGSAGTAYRRAARTDRGAHPRRQSRPGLALRQAGAAQHRRRHGGRRRQAGHARRLGRAGTPPRRQGHPHRRARHAGVRATPKQRGEFVNTWSVDGFVSEGCAARRDGLGHARAQLSARRQAPRLRLPGRHLPDAAGGGHAGAHLDAARRTFPRLLHHARRVDLDRRLLHGARGFADRLPADRALRLPPVRCGGDVGAASSPAATTCSRNASASSRTTS